MKAAGTDYDVAILGAGLVGMALAAALARQGLRVALLERSALAAFDGPAGAGDWDQRVYAVSPGSAEFLRALGAWQRLAADRIAAIEVMDVHGDSEGAIAFSAYELGERALAWIVRTARSPRRWVEVVRTAERVDVLALRAECGRMERRRCPGHARRRRSLLHASSSVPTAYDPGSVAKPASRASRNPTGRRLLSPTLPPSVRTADARSSGLSRGKACSRGCRCLGGESRSCGRRPKRSRRSFSRWTLRRSRRASAQQAAWLSAP